MVVAFWAVMMLLKDELLWIFPLEDTLED